MRILTLLIVLGIFSVYALLIFQVVIPKLNHRQTWPLFRGWRRRARLRLLRANDAVEQERIEFELDQLESEVVKAKLKALNKTLDE
jgi:hypothetical protein